MARIIQLVDSLSIGGTERMAVNISNALSDDGHLVILVAARRGGSMAHSLNDAIQLEILGKRRSFDLMAFKKLTSLVRINNIEIIHAHSSSIFWAVAIKILYPRIKVIWHDHYGNSEFLKDKDRLPIRIIKKYIDGVIAVNTKLADWSIRNLKNSQSVVFIPNFPWLKEIPKVEKKIPQLVCLANFRLQKDHLNLLRAISYVQVVKPDLIFELHLVGSVGDVEYYNQLKLYVDAHKLNKIVFFSGSTTDTAKVLSKMDVGILSSKSEGLPVSLLEYGLASLIPVVTDVGECNQVLNKGEFGKLIPPSDFEKLGVAILTVLDDINYFKNNANLFREYIKENYGSKKFLNIYYHFLSNIGYK